MVLQVIAAQGPLSRNAIARRCGISPSGVSRAVGELQRAGVVVESQTRPGRPGRPERLVQLNGEYGYVEGVNLAGRVVEAVLVTLDGRQVASARMDAGDTTPERLLSAARELRDRMCRKVGISPGAVVAAGISVAGLVDSAAGICRRSTVLGWTGVPVRQMAERLLGVRVQVGNDANAVALSELLLGSLKGTRHALVVAIGEGIGSGMIGDGRLFTGATGGAGEIGHLTVQPEGEACQCGKRGCLETVASLSTLRARLGRALGRSVEARGLGKVLRMRDAAVREIVSAAGRALGYALAAALNLLDVEAILVVSAEADLSPLKPFVDEALREHAQPDLLSGAKLAFRKLPAAMWSFGAASLALDSLFSSLEWLDVG